MLKRFLLSFFVILLSTSLNFSQNQKMSAGFVGDREIYKAVWKGDTIYYVNSFSCVLKESLSLDEIINFIESYGGSIRFNNFDNYKWGSIDLPEEYDVLDLVDEWQTSGLFSSVEPVRRAFTSSIVDDPAYLAGLQWYFYNYGQVPGGTIDADVDMPEAWAITMGSPQILISVIDSGIPLDENTLELSHPDLDNSNRIILDYSKLFLTDVENFVRDGYGHGTHVTGILAAETNNDEGIAGTAGNCRIMVCRVFDDEGDGADDAVIAAILYSVDYYWAGLRVINMSLSTDGASPALENAIAAAQDSNILIVAAAGNYPGSNKYPARYSVDYDNVIAVSATDHNDSVSRYSHAGIHINVAAPGGYGPLSTCADENDVFSTFPNYFHTMQLDCPPLFNWWGYLQGTSMSTPIVSGIAALILSINPDLSPSEVRGILESSADDKGDPGWDPYYGHGRVNAYNALKYTLENYGGTLTQDLYIPVGETWNFNVPGVLVTLENGASIIVDGTLNVNGTSSDGIAFDFITKQSGNGIKINSGATANIYYSDIKNAIYGVYFNSGTGTVDHCTITNCYYGVYVTSATPTIQYCSINNNYYGLRIFNSYSQSWTARNIANNSITGNTAYGVYLYNSSPTLTYNTVTGNNNNGSSF